MDRIWKKREKGSITVEASISLTCFIFVMVCVMMLINVGRAQMKIQLAANKSAQQISQYMYILKVTGIYDTAQSVKEIGNESDSTAKSAEDNINEAVQVLSSFSGQVSSTAEKYTAGATSFADVDGMVDDIKDLYNNAQTTGSTLQKNYEGLFNIVSGVADDPVGFLKSMEAFLTSTAYDTANSWLFGAVIGGALVKKNLGGDEADAYLKSLNVVDGIDGLDYSHSKILQDGFSANGAEDVNIVIIYKVKVLPLLDINLESTFAVSASTRAWLGGDCLTIKKLVK